MILQTAFEISQNASPVIAGLSYYAAALTTAQRLEAVTRLYSSPAAERSFAIFGIIAAAAMTLLFIFVTIIRRRYEKMGWQIAFNDLAQRMGLSGDERKLLTNMAQTAQIKAAYTLLTDWKLFDRSASKMIEKAENERKDEKKAKALKLELTFLREKLGFRKRFTLSALSREPAANQSGGIKPVNRRRFVRAPVRKQAFIASFDFERDITLNGYPKGGYEISDAEQNRSLLPDFKPAVLTEIGGPGLRLESDLQVRTGDRVLVAFGLEQSGEHSYLRSGTEFAYNKKRLIRDIAVVRNVGGNTGRQSIAVELVGLNDNELDGLVKATNAELIRNVKSGKLSADYETQRLVSSFIRS